ncbi:MAG TPA: SH3 domain-containing protein [Pyrinomonadaceae bacterium]|nr:SH3 domain-containing protein [Pyrinomonadaceae bacterium]
MIARFLRVRLSIAFFVFVVTWSALNSQALAQQRRAATGGQRATIGGQRAVVVDERLAALRESPELSSRLLQRMSRGRKVSIIGSRRVSDELTFYRVMLTKRTGGWVQSEAVISTARKDDDERLLRLIRGSEDFDRLSRAHIFLDLFPKSPLRPTVLMLYAEAAEEAAGRLTRDAARRLNAHEMKAGGAPDYSYFLNYSGLDRYNRQGVSFVFDRAAKRFYYNGAAWREIVRRYPQSPEAEAARKRLEALALVQKR